MNNKTQKKTIGFLQKRIEYLEDINRLTLDALETAASLCDFQPSINRLQNNLNILNETRVRLHRLIQWKVTAFYMVDEKNFDFSLSSVDPVHFKQSVQYDVDYFIENGTFALALRERRPLIVISEDYKRRFIIHVMATSTKVRGMFIGQLDEQQEDVSDISLSMMSIILLNSSNALESNELYNTIWNINDSLQKKENYKTLFEAAPDGVEVLDGRGTIIDCNESQLAMLGYKRDDIIGNHTSFIFSDRCKDLFNDKYAVLKERGYFEGEIELVRRDGSIVPVWRKEKAIVNDKGEFVGAVIYNRDLMARKHAEEEKKRLQAKLQRAEKMEALGTLAGGVAHDLNNVLSGLVSYPELLLMQLPDDSPLRKPIATIQKSGEKAAAIVQDLLTLARRGVTAAEVVNLNQIIFDYLQTPEHERLLYFHPSIEIETNLESNLLNIVGSPVHLSKTIMNLILNAAEAMHKGGKIRIITENRYIDNPIRGYDDVNEGDYAILKVIDDGVGISPDDMDRIFEPFYTKKVMGRSGTGLGMAVVWGTMKDHRGYIDVWSIQGRGTVFTLYFPVTREDMFDEKKMMVIDNYRATGERILVVDDIPEQRELASQMLGNLGYEVITASSGEDAVEFMTTNSVDLLLLDMIMEPGMDGLETYKKILELHPGQKAIIVSGFSETDRVKEAKRLGAGAYVKKPYLMQKIGMAIKYELTR